MIKKIRAKIHSLILSVLLYIARYESVESVFSRNLEQTQNQPTWLPIIIITTLYLHNTNYNYSHLHLRLLHQLPDTYPPHIPHLHHTYRYLPAQWSKNPHAKKRNSKGTQIDLRQSNFEYCSICSCKKDTFFLSSVRNFSLDFFFLGFPLMVNRCGQKNLYSKQIIEKKTMRSILLLIGV